MTYSELHEYFIQISLDDPVIMSIEFVEDWSDIIELQLARSNYPALIIEEHQIVADTESASVELKIEGAMSVITGCPEDEKPAYYKAVLKENLKTLLRLQERITCDSDAEGLFAADLSVQYDKIRKATADNCYGYRIYYSISEITKDEA